VKASDGTHLTPREAAIRTVVRTTVRPALMGTLPLSISRRLLQAATVTVPVRRGTRIRHGHLAGVPVEVVRRQGGGTDEHVLLYLHGGGFVTGSPRTHRPLTAELAHHAGATVVVPDYRLAPEDPFPAAVDDAAAVYGALVERGPARLTVAGDSAGGNLAVGLASTVSVAGTRAFDAVAAISPFVDPTMPAGGSWDTADCAMLTRSGGEAFRRDYTPGGEHLDPRVSVHLGPLAGLPPTLVQVGGAEALRDDSVLLAAAAAAASAPLHVQEWPGMWHVHQATPHLLPAADRAIADLAAFLAHGTLPAATRTAATFR
jgi:monoterpene epsilon-lactone hydrolase